jgi:hypothetical protein
LAGNQTCTNLSFTSHCLGRSWQWALTQAGGFEGGRVNPINCPASHPSSPRALHTRDNCILSCARTQAGTTKMLGKVQSAHIPELLSRKPLAKGNWPLCHAVPPSSAYQLLVKGKGRQVLSPDTLPDILSVNEHCRNPQYLRDAGDFNRACGRACKPPAALTTRAAPHPQASQPAPTTALPQLTQLAVVRRSLEMAPAVSASSTTPAKSQNLPSGSRYK